MPESGWSLAVVLGLLSYLTGALPFSLMLGYVLGGKDIRNHGSGNPGATNLARAVSYPAGALGLVLDALKGFVPVWGGGQIVRSFLDISDPALLWLLVLFGFMAVIGHCFPVYLTFRGGKGVATSLGVFLALSPPATGMAFGVWMVLTVLLGWISVASMGAALTFPFLFVMYRYISSGGTLLELSTHPIYLAGVCISVLIVVRHHENIHRLLQGTEEKFYEPEKEERENPEESDT